MHDTDYGLSPLVGETSPTLTITNAQSELDRTTFYASVENRYDAVLSDGAHLYVNVPEPEPPTITEQPQDQTVHEGGTAVFTVTATGTEPFTYTWSQQSPKWRTLDETSSTLTLTDVQPDQAGEYQVVVSGPVEGAENAFSVLAVLTLGDVSEPPTLTITNSALDEITISWTPDDPGWKLQETLSLTNAWMDAASGSANPIAIPADEQAEFYRLLGTE